MSRDQNDLHREIDEYMAERAEPPDDIDDDWDMYGYDEAYEAGKLSESARKRLKAIQVRSTK